jgi:hypothetical protein
LDVRRGNAIVEEAKSMGIPSLLACATREAQRRADAYDRALGAVLANSEAVGEALGAEYADAYELREIDGMTWNEIAATLYCAESTARLWYNRARSFLDGIEAYTWPQATERAEIGTHLVHEMVHTPQMEGEK